MTSGEFDREDVVWTVLYVLAAAVSVEIATVELFGVHFSDTVLDLGGSTFGAVTIAMVISLTILTWVYLTNDSDIRSFDDEYRYAVLLTVGLVLTVPLVPQVKAFVTANDLFALTAIAVQSIGYAAISYMG